jgi:hypothetical protein
LALFLIKKPALCRLFLFAQSHQELMSPTTGRFIFLSLVALSVPCAILPIWMIISLTESIANKQPIIHFDTGLLYFLLISVLWPMAAVEFLGGHNKHNSKPFISWLIQHAGAVFLSWFIICLLLAVIGGFAVPKLLKSHGYQPCHNPNAIHRLGKGESLIFTLEACPLDNQQ